MDAEPWTYQVMAREIVREGRVEPQPDPATPAVSDQRNYLFAELDKDTRYATPPASGSWVGTALEVRVGGRWYSSHHGEPTWSIQRDDPAATTVELPPGTAADDVEAVGAVAVPVGARRRTGGSTSPRSTAASSWEATTCRAHRSCNGAAPRR